mgnify:CR=1 FL=1
MYIFSCAIILWANDIVDIGILNILYGSDREFVLGVNVSLGRLQYTCGHESYEEKPFNILMFKCLNLKKIASLRLGL